MTRPSTKPGLRLAALALVVVPLASPLLVSLGLILGGALAAWRGASELAEMMVALVAEQGEARGVVRRCS